MPKTVTIIKRVCSISTHKYFKTLIIRNTAADYAGSYKGRM